MHYTCTQNEAKWMTICELGRWAAILRPNYLRPIRDGRYTTGSGDIARLAGRHKPPNRSKETTQLVDSTYLAGRYNLSNRATVPT